MADANGQKFWMLSEPNHWQPEDDPARVRYDRDHRRLRLASQRLRPLWPNRWSLELILPTGEEDSSPVRSNLFFFTAQPAVEDGELTITSTSPATLRLSETATDLILQVANLGTDTRATVTLGFPDGRYTTRSAVRPAESLEEGPEVGTEQNSLLTLPLILNQVGAWSLRLTLADGRQSAPYHFTVLPEAAAPLEISGLEGITATDIPTFQRLVFTGQGFQSGMRGRLSFPGDQRAISSGEIQIVDDGRFELFINLQDTAIASALSIVDEVPRAQDAFGTTARWDISSNRVSASGALPVDTPFADSETAVDEVGIYLPPAAYQPTDLTMGHNGILYIALYDSGENAGQVVMVDRRDHWKPFSVPLPIGFVPWRLAAHPDGGVWALNRRDAADLAGPRQLVRIQGEPLPTQALQAYSADTFRPCEENPNPPRSHLLWSGDIGEEGEIGVAITANLKGNLALLSWVPGEAARLRLWQESRWQSPVILEGAQHPFSIKWLSHRRIALLLPGLTSESVVYELPQLAERDSSTEATARRLRPSGGFYPLRQYSGGPFLNGITQPPTYPTGSRFRPLHPLSTRAFAPSGSTAPQFLDSHNVQTVWHRLYLEALIPPKTGIRVFLAATNTLSELDELQDSDWFEHRFGRRFAPGALRAGDPPFDRQIPLGAWVSQASEIPYHSGLLDCPIQPNQQGLFTALIQRAGRRVRSLKGRYLWVRVELKGDGHSTPEIAALRAYASRFSYLNQYLPALYQESVFGLDADELGTSTPADFLERFLDNFEGLLTPLEDRIGRADLLTDARTVPAESLDWLGSWVGVAFESGYPVARRRRLLQAAPQLHRQRGTLNGLKQALDIGSDGGVQGGEIVVLEDFRLRRTFATILGADLADTTNPLTAGLSVSGNSFVGDTLVLGDETQREFLALFQADLPLEDAQDRAAVAAFFDRLAYRVTVYVHSDVTPQDLGLIRRIAELESPTHVLTRVVTTTAPFLVTLSALVGLDTYLRPERPRQTVTLNRSHIGVHDVLQQPASLDPRLTGGFSGDLRYPLARAEVENSPVVGESFTLDGRNSQAFAGRDISLYRWTLADDSEG